MPRLASVTGGFAGFAAIGVSLAPPSGGGESVVGTLYIWGYNSDGQVGDSTTVNKSTATQIGSLSWTQIAAGLKHTLAIRDDGLLFAWGDNANGQLGVGDFLDRLSPVQVGSSSWSRVATRQNTSYAIRDDGLLFAWGDNASGQIGNNSIVDTSGVTTWSKVSDADLYVLAIKSDGTLWGWGFNSQGQLGLNDTESRLVPTQIGNNTWLDVAAGYSGQSHTVAVRSDGTLWSWGANNIGQLGHGDTVSRSSPVQVGAVSTWSKVAAGGSSSAAIRTDGSLYTWGYGPPGNGVNSSYYSPILVSGGGSWSKIDISSANGTTFLGIRDGALLGWGFNNWGLFGTDRTVKLTPTSAAAGTWIDCGTEDQHWNAVRSDGTLWWRGRNIFGSAGAGASTLARSSPIQVGSDTNWSKVRNFHYFNGAGIKTNGTLWYWGYKTPVSDSATYTPTQYGSSTTWANFGSGKGTEYSGFEWVRDSSNYLYGLLNANTYITHYGAAGDGTAGGGAYIIAPYTEKRLGSTSSWKDPQQIGNSSWTSVSAGTDHAVALDSSGNIWSWGLNSDGQVGDSTVIARSSPVQVGSGTSWKSVDAGNKFSLALTSSDALYAWGINTSNQLGDGTLVNKSAPVSIGSASWKSVSAGYDHSVGITSTNALYGWGSYTGGIIQLGTWNYLAVGSQYSSGGYTTDRTFYAVSTSGDLYGWGNNYGVFLGAAPAYTSLYAPTQLTSGISWSKIAALGSMSVVGVDTSGRLWSWGVTARVLGHNDAITRSSPTQVGAGTDWLDVSGNDGYSGHVLALKTNGTLWSWGANAYGQLGLGNTTSTSSPIQVGSSSWTKIAAAWQNSMAIRSDGKLFVWGLTGPSNTGKSVPTQVGTDNWIDIAIDGSYAVGVRSDGQAYVWENFGSNEFSTTQQRFGTTSDFVKCGVTNSGTYFFIKTDGTLWATGNSANGQTGLGEGLFALSAPQQVGSSTSWTQVTGGYNAAIGLDDSQLYRWGAYQNSSNPIRGDGSTGSTFSQDNTPLNISIMRSLIATPTQIGSSTWKTAEAGRANSIITDSSDNVYAWGQNVNSELESLAGTVTSPTAITGATAKLVRKGNGSHTVTIR